MSYLTLSYAAFVLILLVICRLLPARLRHRALLCGSVIFYACFGWQHLPFLLFAALSTYGAALRMETSRNKKRLLMAAIAANAAMWFVIKELPWTIFTLGRGLRVLGLSADIPMLKLIAPVGISYFTLQAIGYLTDVQRGRVEPERDFGRYLLFLSWFPAIVQGPISRYDELAPRLAAGKLPSYDEVRGNLLLILFGLIKKLVIADRLAVFADYCFGGVELEGIILYLGAVAYSVQLYADFSGCVDICRGVSGLFGVELVQNFDRPYLAQSVKEFWARWHMSLSRWLKDYIYIPLGGNRKGTARKYLNLMLTFLVSGLWHGAGWNFFFWGALHATYQIAEQCTGGLCAKVKRALGITPGTFSDRLYRTVITFHLVAFAWIFFRAGGLMSGVDYVARMCSSLSPGLVVDAVLRGVNTESLKEIIKGLLPVGVRLVVMGVNLLVLLLAELRFRKQEDAVEGVLAQHLPIRWAVYLVLIFDVVFFGAYGSGYSMAGFLYGGF